MSPCEAQLRASLADEADDAGFLAAMRIRIAARPLNAPADEYPITLSAEEIARLIRLGEEALASRVEDFTASPGQGSPNGTRR